MMLVTLAQLSQGGSCDRYRSASPASSERSRRTRGARGPCRGTDRRGAPARTPPPPHLRGFRGACGAGRGRRVFGSRALDTAGHLFVGVRGAVGPSRRSDRFEARLHQPQELRLLWPRRSLPALRDERRWERKAAADAPCVGRTCVVARWTEDRLRRRHPRRQGRDLRHQCGRQREAEPDAHRGTRVRSCLVARWAQDRLQPRPERGPTGVRHQRRRERTAAADAPRGAQRGLLPGCRTGRSPLSASTDPTTSTSTSSTPTGAGSGTCHATGGSTTPCRSGARTGRRSPSRASAMATGSST